MTMHEIQESFLRHGEDFRILFSQLSERTSVHAFLITGEKGTGKKTLANLMGMTLLCSSEGSRPCGTCRNCSLAEQGEHPDMIVIEKGKPIAPGVKKERTSIPVEDIREMIRICGIRSTNGNMHVVVIRDADKMTTQAQNCLLKTLEEPPADTCIILVTDHMESLLTTVISRCRIIRMKAWEDEYILSVLREHGVSAQRAADAAAASNGSVGKALELASEEDYWQLRKDVTDVFFGNTSRSEILKISNQWKDKKQIAEEVLSILEMILLMLYESRFGTRHADLSVFPAQWQRFAAEAEMESFVMLSESVRETRRQLQFSVNFQAVLERIIFIFMGEGNRWLL